MLCTINEHSEKFYNYIQYTTKYTDWEKKNIINENEVVFQFRYNKKCLLYLTWDIVQDRVDTIRLFYNSELLFISHRCKRKHIYYATRIIMDMILKYQISCVSL